MPQNPAENKEARTFENHSEEGIGVLLSRPPLLATGVIYLAVLMMVAFFIWSFFGKADVVVKVKGTVTSSIPPKSVYPPASGELLEIYVSEGSPVRKGDPIARLKAPEALAQVTKLIELEIALADAEEEYATVPDQVKTQRLNIEATKLALAQAQANYQRLMDEGLKTLSVTQRLTMQEALSALEQAREAEKMARDDKEKHERLFALPRNGGISKAVLDQKILAFSQAVAQLQQADSKYIQVEMGLRDQIRQQDDQTQQLEAQIGQLEARIAAAELKLSRTESMAMVKLQGARIAAETADKIRIENIDPDGFLVISSPSDGVITEVSARQPGEKVEASKALVSIAPENSGLTLSVKLTDRDRGLLKLGMPARIKFNAFPYQRFGIAEGTLENVSTTTRPAPDGQSAPFYTGKVSLNINQFVARGSTFPIRFGMTATSEIVVERRRFIDLALDPFRKLKK